METLFDAPNGCGSLMLGHCFLICFLMPFKIFRCTCSYCQHQLLPAIAVTDTASSTTVAEATASSVLITLHTSEY